MSEILNQRQAYKETIDGRVLSSSFRSESATYLKYNGLSVRTMVEYYFTGDTTHQLYIMGNISDDTAYLITTSGAATLDEVMTSIAECAFTLYEGYGFRAVRNAVKEMATIIAELSEEYGVNLERTEEFEGYMLSIDYSETEILQDIDYLEDLIYTAARKQQPLQ
ncbi:hypothetical protein [Paenibacillus mucilaginosus]|uniref:hypothetical protein n=1 Tax=Paenibacillus mucilaginosus TaxID=61624 RepID=UPI003D22F41B